MYKIAKTVALVSLLLVVGVYYIDHAKELETVRMESLIVEYNEDMVDHYENGTHKEAIVILMQLDLINEYIDDPVVYYNMSTFFQIYHFQLTRDHSLSKQIIYDKIIKYSKSAYDRSPDIIYKIDLAYSYLIPLVLFKDLEFERDKAYDILEEIASSDTTPSKKIWALSYQSKI